MLLERWRAHIQGQSTQGFVWLHSYLWTAASEMEDNGKVLKMVILSACPDWDFCARTLHENEGQEQQDRATPCQYVKIADNRTYPQVLQKNYLRKRSDKSIGKCDGLK